MEFPHHLLISIHAPLAGCDGQTSASGNAQADFNPRTPCGVRRHKRLYPTVGIIISIHAPLAGCDLCGWSLRRRTTYFNPRTPCGVRPLSLRSISIFSIFQSTHPLRGATYPRTNALPPKKISIHAPLAGCDLPTKDIVELIEIFQSTHPLRGATRHGRLRYGRIRISIHAPLAGCDKTPVTQVSASRISIHAPLAGCDAVAMASATSSV